MLLVVRLAFTWPQLCREVVHDCLRQVVNALFVATVAVPDSDVDGVVGTHAVADATDFVV